MSVVMGRTVHGQRILTTDDTDDADRLEKVVFRIRVIRAIRGSFSESVAVVPRGLAEKGTEVVAGSAENPEESPENVLSPLRVSASPREPSVGLCRTPPRRPGRK